jgi:hypothetical protein
LPHGLGGQRCSVHPTEGTAAMLRTLIIVLVVVILALIVWRLATGRRGV